MKRKKAIINGMATKSSNINIRVRDDLREKIEYLKLLPGGLTGYIERKLDEVVIDKELVARLKQ
jgi:hypothetical protein